MWYQPRDEYDNLPELCFVFPRHVRNPKHKDIWKECLKCIRTHYKDEPVIIIDDNSDQSLIENFAEEDSWIMQNVKVITSEFVGSGEMLPFYYYHKLRLAKKAVILNDSMFIQKPFDKELIDNLQDTRFLWHFHFSCQPSFSDSSMQFYHIQPNILYNLHHGNDLINFFFSNNWAGCFASACIINLKFVDLLDKKYNFMNLVYHVNNRDMRQILERTFAIVSLYELQGKVSHENISILGDICARHPSSFNYTFEDYKNNKLDIPVIKCWNSR